MKRSTWMAVLAAAGILVVAGNLPRLPWDDLASRLRAGVEHRVAAWPRLERTSTAPAPAVAPPHAGRVLIPVAPAGLLVTPQPGVSRRSVPGPRLPGFPAGLSTPAVTGVLSGLVTLLAFLAVSRRDRRGKVWQLARRGFTPARIAPRARVPQDAVRTLLTPGLGARR